MTRKINKHVFMWTIIIYFFVFQRALISISNLFNYADEIFAIIAIMIIFIKSLKRATYLTKDEWIILALLFLTCVIGVIGNISSRLLTNPVYIIIDIISMLKVWLAYYAISITNWSKNVYDQLIKTLAKCGRVLVWVMLFFMIASQIIDIGMTASARYGFRSFQFIYNVPGNFSKTFYFLIPLLTADLNYKTSLYKKLTIGCALIVWTSTMRSRAFAFIAIFLLTAMFFFKLNGKKYGDLVKRKIKIVYMIPVVLIAIAICWNQLIFYFTTDTQARSVLLRFGIMTMLAYFPLGSGFGTFGSNIAATHPAVAFVSGLPSEVDQPYCTTGSSAEHFLL